MTAKLGLRAPLLAGAMIMAMAGAATAQAGCGYHSVSLEPKTALQPTPDLESEAALDEVVTQPAPEATAADTETQVEPVAAVDEVAPRVAHADVTPRPKPAIPIILGTYR